MVKYRPWELESFYDAAIQPFGFCLHTIETTEFLKTSSYLLPDVRQNVELFSSL